MIRSVRMSGFNKKFVPGTRLFAYLYFENQLLSSCHMLHFLTYMHLQTIPLHLGRLSTEIFMDSEKNRKVFTSTI